MEPRHPHLALGSQGEIIVQFESFTSGPGIVEWKTLGSNMTMTEIAESVTYDKSDLCGPPATAHGWNPVPYFFRARIENLGENDIVSYRVGSDEMGWSGWMTFRAPKQPNADAELFATLLADVGEAYIDGSQYHWMEPHSNGVHKGANSAWDPLKRKGSLPVNDPRGSILSAVRSAPKADVVLHIGDLSYATGYESEWSYFMSQITPIASVVPYMTAQGNHERDYAGSGNDIGGDDSGGECGVPTQARFFMPAADQDKGWYSFSLGPVHFIVMDTEFSSFKGTDQYVFFPERPEGDQSRADALGYFCWPSTYVLFHK